jgi:putative ABC transport system permease protein
MTRLRTSRLAFDHLRSGPGTSILVAVLVAVTVLVVALAPRALAQLSTAELRYSLGELSPLRRDLSGTAEFGFPNSGGSPPATPRLVFGPTNAVLLSVSDDLEAPLSSMVGEPQWVVRTGGRTAERTDGVASPVRPVISLAVDLGWADRVEIVDGAPPAPWAGNEADGSDPLARPPIEIAVSQETAENAGLTVGDELAYLPANLRVAAIYRPLDPSDDYWLHALDLKAGEPFPSSEGGTLLYAGAYVDPTAAVGMRETFAAAKLTVWYPIAGEELDFRDAAEVRDQILKLQAVGRMLPSGQSLAFTTGLADAVNQVIERMTLVVSLFALAASGPIGVVLAVFALGVRSVIDRRRAALSLLSARGASGVQARTLMLVEGLLIAVPAGALGLLGAALLIPGPLPPEAFVLPVLLTLTPPVLFAVSTAPASLTGARSDIRVRARNGVRWVLEVAAIGIAALALFLLFRRGLAESSGAVGVDPLLVATPLLLSVAVCVVVLRVYPGLMLGVQRWSRSRRGAVALVGAARAVRAPALGFSASLALVVGMSIAVFSAVLSTTVDEALATNARMTVGADLRAGAAVIGDEADIDALPGVAAVAGIERLSNIAFTAGGREKSVTVVLADLAGLHEVRPDLPGATAASGTQIYLSESLARLVGTTDVTLAERPVELAGVLPDSALPKVPATWVLVDASAAESLRTEFDPHELLIALAGGASGADVAAEVRTLLEEAQSVSRVDSVEVLDASALLASASAEPAISGLRVALLLAAIIAVALSVLAIVLASATAGAVRNRLIAVLRILGMSTRQLRGLMAWELGPVAIVAIVAGTALGLAELWIVLAALDLRPFLGGDVPPTPTVDPAQVAAVVGAFVVVVLIAGPSRRPSAVDSAPRATSRWEPNDHADQMPRPGADLLRRGRRGASASGAQPRGRAGRAHRDRRRVRIGQIDAAQHPLGPRHADRRFGHRGGSRPAHHVDARTHGVPTPHRGLRLPADRAQPAAVLHGGPEHRHGPRGRPAAAEDA